MEKNIFCEENEMSIWEKLACSFFLCPSLLINMPVINTERQTRLEERQLLFQNLDHLNNNVKTDSLESGANTLLSFRCKSTNSIVMDAEMIAF